MGASTLAAIVMAFGSPGDPETLMVLPSVPSACLSTEQAVVPVITPPVPEQVSGAPQPAQSTLPASAPPSAPIGDDIIVVARHRTDRGGPIEAINAKTFAVAQATDDAILGPAAFIFSKAVPAPLRNGLHNFLDNLHEPIVFVNYLLQLKPGKAGETAGRFALNSTVGLAGLFDVAKRAPFRLPRRRNGFADTLGYYGVRTGPFLFLPFIGPTTVRDLIGDTVDRFVLPLSGVRLFRKPVYAIPITVLNTLNRRVEFDEQLQQVRASSNPYAARRDQYLTYRQAEIDELRGKLPDSTKAAPTTSNPVPPPGTPDLFPSPGW